MYFRLGQQLSTIPVCFRCPSLTSLLQTPCWSLWPAWQFTLATSSCRSTSWRSCTTSRLFNDTMTLLIPLLVQSLSMAFCLSIYLPACLGFEVGIVSNHAETELLLLPNANLLSKVKTCRTMLDIVVLNDCFCRKTWDYEQTVTQRQGLRGVYA